MAAFDYDEDGNFWSYDIMSGLVRAYSPAGELIQALRLVQADGEAVVPQRLHLRGSEFLLVSTTSLAAFDRFGLPLWRMDKPSPQSDPLMESMIYGSAIGTDGSLYLLLSGGGLTLTRYDDARSLDAQRRLGDDAFASTLERAIALNAAVRADTDSEAAYAARAKFFQESGLSMSELTLRDAFAAAFPGNRENAKRLGDLKAGLLRAAALSAADAVYDPLARYGAETARADYQKAMRLLERYLGDHPDDTKLAQAMAALGDAFRARESGVAPFKKTPLIIEAKIGPLFPAFMERYRTVPAGYVRIRNAGSESVQGISLSLSIKDFMDYPLELKLPGPLAAGAALELPIALVLNRSVLELREELTVAALVRADSDKAEGSAALSIVFRSRTALTWEDTAALAAFITPNDDAIVSFVHAALFFDPPPLFGRAFSRAFAIVNALGARGLVYVEDPLTPFTLVAAGGSRGSSPLIDTVRFPRSTLGSGAGDCDDTTALLASCLEAAGVRTAILTTPGHVLLAFAADGPPDGPGRYGIDPKRYGAIERDGSWWIPLETTVLSKGFAEAWRQGYAEASARLAALELVPLAVARSAYPALPLAGTPGEAPLAAPAAYSALARSSLAALKDSFVLPQQLAATNARAGKAGAELFNNLGVRLVQLGDYSEAATAFREAARLDPLSSPPRVNLITALSLAGDDKGAAEALALAERDFPGSASIGRLAQRLGTRLVQAPSTVSGTAGTGLAGSASGIEGTRSSGASLIELEW
jgi:tetratricopeptide (TPR) repeat protein